MEQRDFGFKGLCRQINHTSWRRDMGYSLSISVLISFFLCFQIEDSLEFLLFLVGLFLEVTTTLLGLSFASYSLLLGFGAFSSLKQFGKEGKKLYRKINAQFLFYILSQVASLSFAITLSLFSKNPPLVDDFLANCTNRIVILVILFFLSYQIWMLKDVIILIYNYIVFEDDI